MKLSNRSVRIIGSLSVVAEGKEYSWFNAGSCLLIKGYSGLLASMFATNPSQSEHTGLEHVQGIARPCIYIKRVDN